jgi:peptide/nickel transport system substrate-binding protein
VESRTFSFVACATGGFAMSTLRSLFLFVLLCLVVACSAAAPESPIPESSSEMPTDSPSAPSGTAKPDTLVLAIGGESEEGYDPTLGWGRYGSPLFQSTLLRRDEKLNIVNDLATGYSVSDDGLTWNVTIRSDVKFSDGSPLTAADVAYTFNKAAESGGLTDVTVLDEAVATSDTEVQFTLKEPQSTFVNRLITLGIVPAATHGEGYARNPIGSGPYQLVQWDEGQQLIVEANPLYYGTTPDLQRLVFLFTEEDTAFAAVKSGEAQVAAVPQALAIQEVPGARVVVVQSVDNRGLLFPYVPNIGETTAEGFPIGNNVTADLAIRRAVNYAINREALVAGVLEGFGSPAHGPVSGLAWEATDAVIEDNNVESAKEILAEGGWTDSDGNGVVDKDGLKAEFTIIYPASDSTRQALALAAADMIRPTGIAINVEGKSWDDIPALKHTNVVLFGWGSHDQTEMYNLYHSKAATGAYYNAGYYANSAIDEYLDLAMGASSEAEAIALWQDAQWDGTMGFTTKGDAAWAWMVNLNHTYFVNECLNVGNPQVEPHGHGWPITANIESWTWICE